MIKTELFKRSTCLLSITYRTKTRNGRGWQRLFRAIFEIIKKALCYLSIKLQRAYASASRFNLWLCLCIDETAAFFMIWLCGWVGWGVSLLRERHSVQICLASLLKISLQLCRFPLPTRLRMRRCARRAYASASRAYASADPAVGTHCAV